MWWIQKQMWKRFFWRKRLGVIWMILQGHNVSPASPYEIRFENSRLATYTPAFSFALFGYCCWYFFSFFLIVLQLRRAKKRVVTMWSCWRDVVATLRKATWSKLERSCGLSIDDFCELLNFRGWVSQDQVSQKKSPTMHHAAPACVCKWILRSLAGPNNAIL